ncbi:MAG: hypothetical protein NVSMB54_30070 [Ktedonobacteraceae bacterium]
MLPMPLPSKPRCDCCGALITLHTGDFCRCGYPVSLLKEERFLEESLRNLQRVATYGGAQATVTSLLQRYQARLDAIRLQLYVAPIPHAEVVVPPSVHPVAALYANNRVPPSADIPRASAEHRSVTPSTQPVQVAPASSTPQQMFSLRSFFAEQTINIVSSLGAFLILIGSLSFVATTTNLFLSFLVLFIVHLIFATVGFVFHRFPSFRFISHVYTAIFALLVPLVGFSGYRLVAGHLIQLSAPSVVAIAAIYAAIVYALLAVSQQYKPFGYLAAAALVLADLAFAFAVHLNYWWWPVLLMPLAFVALLSVNNTGRLFHRNSAVLREPVRVLMYICVVVLCLDVLYTYPYVVAIESASHPFLEIRVAGASMLFLVLAWTCVYLWVAKQFTWLVVVPYQFLGLVIALAYVFDVHSVYYGLLFTSVAVFYHVGTLMARHSLQRFQFVRNHMESIALILVALVPLLVAQPLPLQLLEVAYSVRDIQFLVNGDTFLALIALIASCALTVSIVLSRVGLQRIPASTHIAWSWLLLLSGFLFTWAYSIVVLWLHIVPAYAFLALTLALLIGTIIVRRSMSAAWSNPLDVLVLVEAALTLLLHLRYGIDANLALLCLFAILSYSVIVYQRRHIWLFVPVVFILLAFPALVERPRIMLLLGVVLPLVALVLAKIEQYRRRVADTVASDSRITLTSLFSWEWPVLASGLFYGIVVCSVDALAPTSTAQSWLGMPFSVALEMAALALVWYVVAALTRQKWMLFVTIGFAVAGLLVPSNSFWALACFAGVAALLALGVGRIVAKIWAIPLYVVAILAAVLMGIDGYTGGHGQLAFVSWTLLGFALLIYSIGVLENFLPFLWLAPVFAIWSVYDAALLGDLYRPPVIALLCAGIGVGIGCLTCITPSFAPRKGALLQFSLPFYITALAAAVLTGVYGVLGGINSPFPTAIPDALLFYALIAYAVLVFERQARWLWLVAVFAVWGIVLVTRLNTDMFKSISAQVVFPTYYLTGIALVTGGIAIAVGRFSKTRDGAPSLMLTAFTWSWPWYCVSLFAIALMVAWNTLMGGVQVSGVTVYSSLFAFILLAFAVMLVERRRELLIIPISLALWGIVQTHWAPWQQMGALSLLFFLVFAMRYTWHLLPTQGSWQRMLYTLLGIGGQVVIILAIIGQGGLSPDARALVHVGIGVLLLLALQLFWYGWVEQEKHYWTMYTAGLLVALAVSWELSTFQLTGIEWLTLVPATYLIVIAPFVSRNEHMLQHQRIGQLCSILGASLLLLPTLWSSFNELSIQPTFILAGEALALLLLGVTLRTRFFVLSGAGLVIVSAMHALFLPSLGLPPSLALTIMGVTLLVLATALSLTRHRLQTVWTHLD